MRDDLKNLIKRGDLLDVYPKWKAAMGNSVEVLRVHEELGSLSAKENFRDGPFYDVMTTNGRVWGGISHKRFSRRFSGWHTLCPDRRNDELQAD